MEGSRKKPIMVTLVVVCLVAAGVVTYVTRSGGKTGLDAVKRGQMIWMKCGNSDCEAEYQMDLKDYYEDIQDRWRPMMMGPPPLTCNECNEDSLYRVEKCPSCEVLFQKGSVEDDFADKCPECGYSQTEENRKKARGE